MKCLFLEQQLHLFCLCSPVCAKGARTEHLYQLHTNQLFVKALIQIHPTKFSDAEVPMNTLCPCLWLSNAPLGMPFPLWRAPRCWIHPPWLPGLTWNTEKSLITLISLTSCTWSKTLSYFIFGFHGISQILWISHLLCSSFLSSETLTDNYW